MRFARRRHSVPELNTTSTADISFMLLIFFLVTTNMDVDKGLTRQLPPPDRQEAQETFVAKGTMLALRLTAADSLLVDGNLMPFSGLRQHVEAFVSRVGKRHVIKLDVSPQSSYDAYFQLQNELVAAYRSLRNQTARRLFGRDYDALSPAQRDKVREQCPQRIAEQYNGSAAVGNENPQRGGAL